jgi:hypothetical protein
MMLYDGIAQLMNQSHQLFFALKFLILCLQGFGHFSPPFTCVAYAIEAFSGTYFQ